MLKPGALGLRVHDLYSTVSGIPGLLAMQPTRLSSYQGQINMIKEIIAALPEFRATGPLHVTIPIERPEDIHAVLQAMEGIITTTSSKGGNPPPPILIQPQVTLQLGPDVDENALQAAAGLVKQSALAGMPARVLLKHAWASSSAPDCDPDENLHQGSAYEASLAVADADAGVIVLSDCMGCATEDSLRDAIEALFNIDCAGESMMERLALRLGDAKLCRGAMRLGVTRFDVNCCPYLMADDMGSCRKSKDAGGCACKSKGLKCVMGLRELMIEAQEMGIKKRINVNAIDSVMQNLKQLSIIAV